MKSLKPLVVLLSTCLAAVILVGAVAEKTGPPEAAYKHLRVYTEVLSRIKSDYVEEPDLKNVTLGAINGLLQSVDPFASYLSPEQYREFQKPKDSGKGEIGALLSWKYGYLGVVDTVPGSSADLAGISTGDMLETINGIATRDMPLAYAEMLLRGKPGSTVEISVLSVRQPEPKKLTLTRTVIDYPPVTHRMLPQQVGLIQVYSLVSGKAGEVAEAVKALEAEGAKGLVLDLRRCATGIPEEGIALANLFLEKGLITYVQGQRQTRQDFNADPTKTLTRLPLVVLTNRGTANGAEVAAAALLENKRAEVVGEPTYGSAGVRRPITMDDGSAIILSVAKYFSPRGKAIQDVKVTPSVQVLQAEPPPAAAEDEEEQPEQVPVPQAAPEGDRILEKGVEVLTQGKSAGNAPVARQDSSPAMSPLGVPRGPGR